MPSDHQWKYLKTTLLEEVEVGPVTEAEIKQLALDGKIQGSTAVMSPTRTKGQWVKLAQLPGLKKLRDQGKAQRKQERQDVKESAAAEKKRSRELAKAQTLAAPVEAELVEKESATQTKIRAHIAKYLTRDEVIEFVVIQAKPVVIKSDAVVVTNRRLMIVRQKMLGRFEFHDMLWRDSQDAHIKENIIGATFSMKNNKDGSVITIDMLPKSGARNLYQLAQEREEQAEETRRNRKMEETAAGAAKINLGNSPAPSNEPFSDPIVRLQKLKTMLESELITQDEFDKRKTEILNSV